jgi:hypothetical protein
MWDSFFLSFFFLILLFLLLFLLLLLLLLLLQVTWGTSPQDVLPITGSVPDPKSFPDEARRRAAERALA